jgi:hypothetical protein
MLSSLFITFAKKLDSLYTCLSSSQCGQAFCTLRALYGNAQLYMFLHFFAMWRFSLNWEARPTSLPSRLQSNNGHPYTAPLKYVIYRKEHTQNVPQTKTPAQWMKQHASCRVGIGAAGMYQCRNRSQTRPQTIKLGGGEGGEETRR